MPKRKTHNEFVKEVNDLVGIEYQILGTYINSSTKIKMLHVECNTQYEVSPSKFVYGNRCPECFGNKRKTTIKFKKEVYDLVGEEYSVLEEYTSNHKKIKMKHEKCCYSYSVTPYMFLQGKRCPNCFGKKPYTTETFKSKMLELAGEEYSLLSEYVNTDAKVKIKHNICDNCYMVRPNKFIVGQRCPLCKNSKGEKFINKFLSDKNVDYIREYRFDNCRNTLPLSFDFVIFDEKKKVKLIIEYDGVQHFIPSFGKTAFEKTKTNDEIKNKFCKENNLNLLRIPYFEFDQMESILKENII